jgi:hypothetical protein
MCWIGKITDKHIAKAGDIPVYKVLLMRDNRLFSPYQNMLYIENMLYTKDIEPEIGEKEIRIEKGLHCYSGSCMVKMKDDHTDRDIVVDMKRRSRLYYGSYGRNNDDGIMTVFRGVIPKGTVYYENEHGEIASEELKILHRLYVPYFDFKPFRDLKPYDTK